MGCGHMSPTAARTVAPAGERAVARPPLRAAKPTPVHLISPLQRKPVIGAVDDPLEREADRVADAVVADRFAAPISSARPSVPQRKCAACEAAEEHGEEPCDDCAGGTIQRVVDAGENGEDENDEESVLRKPEAGSVGHGGAAFAAQAVTAGGTPMPAPLRAYFEPRFGRSFGDVRLHAGGAASDASRAIHARAYTLGHDIAFAAGAYAPQSFEGRRLIAHELAHVVQQEGGLQPVIRRQDGRERRERESGESVASTEADIKELTRQEQRDAEIRESRTSPGRVHTSVQPFRITLDDFAVDSAELKKLHEGGARRAPRHPQECSRRQPAGRHCRPCRRNRRRRAQSRAVAKTRACRDAAATWRARDQRRNPLGLGEAQPAAPNGTVEGRKRNRRVEIYFLPGPSIEVKKPSRSRSRESK